MGERAVKKRKTSILSFELVATVILLACGVFFRVYGFGNYPFGFDQVQILEAANGILQGDITLIGPRTGPADLFTGPLIYYITAPFLLFLQMEQVVVIVPTLIALASAIVLSEILKKDFAVREKVLFLSFWAFSPFLVRLDRIFWNPNLMMLAAGLSFFPVVHARRKHFSFSRALLFFLGGFLGYQAHFSGLLLPALVLVTVLVFKKNGKYAVASLLGLGVSMLPTLVFDLRNNWLNTKGVLSLLQGSGSESSVVTVITDFIHSGYILIESLGKLVLLDRGTDAVVTAGVVVLLLSFTVARKRKQLVLADIWLLGIMVSFSFYPDNKPEYYYTVAIPALLLFFFRLSRKVSATVLVVAMVIFFVLSTQTTLDSIKIDGSLSLGSAVFVRDSVYQITSTEGVSKVSFDMPYGSDTGYAFVLQDLPRRESGRHVHVSYPNFYQFSSIQQYGGTATWIDPRTETGEYVLSNQAIVSYPTDITKVVRNETANGELVSLHFIAEGKDWGTLERVMRDDCTAGEINSDSVFFSFGDESDTALVNSECYLFSGPSDHKDQLGIY
jgi:hypothetical protein